MELSVTKYDCVPAATARNTELTTMKPLHPLPNTNLSARFSPLQPQINGSLRELMSKMPSLKHQLIGRYS